MVAAIVLGISAAWLTPHAVLAQDIGLEIGTTATPVVLEDLDGKPVDLAQYIGKKPVLLEFWATWCPLCQALEPRIAAAQKKFGDRFAIIIVAVGVNQTPRSIKRHIADHALPGIIVWDAKGKAVRAFAAPSTSYVVMLDAKGRVTYTGSGEDQDIVGVVTKALAK